MEMFEKCQTLRQIQTPNKVNITCQYPLEGRYITIVKGDGGKLSTISLNEIVPLLHGKTSDFFF